MKNYLRITTIFAILGSIAAFYFYDLNTYLTLEYIKDRQADFNLFYQNNPSKTVLIFSTIYITSAALALPGAALLTLMSGALFGMNLGGMIVCPASTIGATISFLISRFILRDFVENKFQEKTKIINQGINKEGAFYLFALRLIPLFPFFLINLAMGLTKIRTLTFVIVSLFGMMPGTLVYVYAGTKLGNINQVSDILSLDLFFAFALIGIFPFIAKIIVSTLKKKSLYKNFKKPKNFDYNMVVIGAGAGGLVSSYIASAVKAKVALIEKDKMGGDCLNTGCVPSKALIKSAKIMTLSKNAKKYGFDKIETSFEFSKIISRVQDVIKKIEPHDSVDRYNKLGVDCISGDAEILDPYRVKINKKVLTTKNIVIATGASPLVPPIPGLDKIDYLTSDNLWQLKELPKRFLVLGGGPIGCELSSAFARLGSSVTQIEMMPQILIREDEEVVELVTEKFKSENINVLTGHKAKEFKTIKGKKYLICDAHDKEVKIEFDEVLVALGRKARVSGFGLEKLNATLTPRGTIEVNDFLQTNYPNIYAVGDVVGPYQFTHTAAHQAWYAAVNSLFGRFKKFKVDYRVIPWTTFTDPEIARVGLNEKDAKAQNIAYEVTKFDISELDRAITESEDFGFIKVLTVPKKDKILGVTIVSHNAGEILAEFVLAMKHNLGLNKILGTIHSYPTYMEANKYVAGQWKNDHTSKRMLNFLKKFHQWERR
jgi:dihydrolipoamide dehydrogenase